jgi:hypothetical protein
MKPKKGKPVKKYAVGGAIAAQAGLAGLQALLGGSQFFGGTAMANKLKAPSTSTPSAWKDFYESAQNQSLVQQNIDQINQSAATYLQALQAGGTQAVGAGLQPLARQTQRSTQDVYNQQIMREMQAAGQLAAADERALGRERDVYETRLGEAQAARAAGIQNVFGALGSAGKGIVDLTASRTEGPDRALMSTTDAAPVEQDSFIDQVSIQPAGGMVKPASKIPSLAGAGLENLTPEFLRSIFEDGGMMTGGKFSHKTNPIDIVQKGTKIGEMTGGEVILNPAQQKKLSKESTYFRQLLKKFNKQK